ncbi:hypothetical protein JCM10207_002397 [Rhodosporidiobolus poonsookiae]
MLRLSLLVALLTAGLSSAQTCPQGTTQYPAFDPSVGRYESCCNFVSPIPRSEQCYYYDQTFHCTLNPAFNPGTTRVTIRAGTRITALKGIVVGGKGQDVQGKKGGTGSRIDFKYPDVNLGTLANDLTYISYLGYGASVPLRPAEYTGGEGIGVAGIDYGLGGAYAAVGNPDCAAAHPNQPTGDGWDCRLVVAAGGGGASSSFDGGSAYPSNGGNPGNAVFTPSPGRSGGGGGIKGGGAPMKPFQDESEVATGSGAGGTSNILDTRFRTVFFGALASQPQFEIHITAPDVECRPLGETTVTSYAATSTITQTEYVSTLTEPGPTITEAPRTTITEYPEPSTATETSTEEIDLGPETYDNYVQGEDITPPPTTVQVSTDVTSTPEATTITSTHTPGVSTVYETSYATSTPPTSTITSVKLVPTGNAPCTQLRLVFPAECCPSAYMTLRRKEITPAARKRDLPLTRFEKRAATRTIQGGTTTETSIISATKTEQGAPSTITEPVTITEQGDASTTTVTETETVTLPRLQVPNDITVHDTLEPVTYYETQTNSHEAPTPTQTNIEEAPTPLTTVTVHSTTTLATPVTTTTTTAYVQSTACAIRTAYTSTSCSLPNTPLLTSVSQEAQKAVINLNKGLSPGRPVLIDCGRAGLFEY